MIGGLGPESTVDYYRSIIARYRARKPDGGYPHVIINSLDVDKGIALLDAGRLSDLADYLAAGVESLARAGASFGFIAANTPHLVFDEIQRRSAIPLLSIVRATSDYAKARGLKKLGLFGTGITMRASFYPEEFKRAGIALVRPNETELEFIHRKYIDETAAQPILARNQGGDFRHRAKDEEPRRYRSGSPRRYGTPAAIARLRGSGY
jgi:aspartate racemase